MTAAVAIYGQLLSIRESIVSNLLTEDRWKMMVEGLGVTLENSLLSLLLATLIGALVCSLRMSRSKVVSHTARIYIELMRSLPLLLLLLVMFYLVFASSVLEQIPNDNIPLKLVRGMCSSLRETEAGKILVEM